MRRVRQKWSGILPVSTPARLPVPDWSRPGETWRVRGERHMTVVEPGGYCTHHVQRVWCNRPAVAALTRGAQLFCDEHLRAGCMWVEDGRVVSWYLSP